MKAAASRPPNSVPAKLNKGLMSMWLATPKHRRMLHSVGGSMFQSVDGNVLQLIGGGVPMSQSVDGNTPMFQSTEGNFPMIQPVDGNGGNVLQSIDEKSSSKVELSCERCSFKTSNQ